MRSADAIRPRRSGSVLTASRPEHLAHAFRASDPLIGLGPMSPLRKCSALSLLLAVVHLGTAAAAGATPSNTYAYLTNGVATSACTVTDPCLTSGYFVVHDNFGARLGARHHVESSVPTAGSHSPRTQATWAACLSHTR